MCVLLPNRYFCVEEEKEKRHEEGVEGQKKELYLETEETQIFGFLSRRRSIKMEPSSSSRKKHDGHDERQPWKAVEKPSST
mmetsp:Transcript_7332/g.11459  ORF Transcript_7332/g.11459 Transcript_7332/m.11459 type:complete len:81 (+) Transcript_7332:1925-2167(+)